jgi:hypothetical protein
MPERGGGVGKERLPEFERINRRRKIIDRVLCKSYTCSRYYLAVMVGNIEKNCCLCQRGVILDGARPINFYLTLKAVCSRPLRVSPDIEFG